MEEFEDFNDYLYDISTDSEPEDDRSYKDFSSDEDYDEFEENSGIFSQVYLKNVFYCPEHQKDFEELNESIDKLDYENIRKIIENNTEIVNFCNIPYANVKNERPYIDPTGIDRNILARPNVITNIEMLKFLIDLGANPLMGPEKDTRYPIEYACKNGDLDIVKFLYDKMKVMKKFNSEFHMVDLFVPLCKQNIEDIIYFIHDKVPFGEAINGLQNAIMKKHVNVVRFLAPLYRAHRILEEASLCEEMINLVIPFYDPNSSIQGAGYMTNIIQAACRDGKYHIFESLLRYCNIEACDGCGRTTLFYISYHTDVKIIEYLMKHANLNHTDYRGDNAIMKFARMNKMWLLNNFEIIMSYKHLFDTTIKNAKGQNFDDLMKKYSKIFGKKN